MAKKKSSKQSAVATAPTKKPKLKGISQRDMAKLLPRSLQWLRASEAPRLPDKSYDPPAVIEWYLQAETQKIRRKIIPSDPLKVWKAKTAELEYKKKAGEYILRDHVHFLFSAVVKPFQDSIKAIEQEYGKPAGDILRAAIDVARAKLTALENK